MSYDLEKALFEFDLNGFVVIRNKIPVEEIEEMILWWEINKKERHLFDLSFTLNTPWPKLIDHSSYWEIISALFNSAPRLDHAFGVSEKFTSAGGKLHHHANMTSSGIFHTTHFGKLFMGMVGVSIALTHIGKGKGGFCCIPGSHKSYLPVPETFMETGNNPLLVQVPQEPGDVIVFSEALTHGTYPIENRHVRKSVIIRYTHGYSAFRQPEVSFLDRLPISPNYEHTDDEGLVDRSSLTDRQATIACRAPFARGRSSIPTT